MNSKVKKLFSYYKPYRAMLLADLFFAVLGAAVSLIIPLLVRSVTSGSALSGGFSFAGLLPLALLLTALVLIEFGCNYFIGYQGHIMGSKMEADMRSEIFRHYQRLSFSFYDEQKIGHLMSRITSDLFEISELLHHGPEDLLISAIKLIGSFCILLSINGKLALLAFALIPFMVIYAIFFNRRMKRAFKNNRARIAHINSRIEDNLSGIRVVKSFANEAAEDEKFEIGNREFLAAKRASYRYMGAYSSGINAMSTMITVLVLLCGAAMIAGNTLTVSDLIAFLLYISNFVEPVKKLVNFTEQFQNGYTGFERFYEILSISPEIQDSPDAVSLSAPLRGEIDFKEVFFRYQTGEPVLKNVTLHVRPGEYIALVGPSGVGKTTLCSLIPRFYEVSSGAVLIDGIDIRTMKQDQLHNNIGIVQQDVYLFMGTAMENIRYGRPNATDEEVIEAAKKANAHDFITALPEGYHTDIGQRGVKLSGGQKQRLAIARVFLKNPPILIFDEATSALDNESERVVQASLESLAQNRTTFVIAHRLSTVHNANRILVLTENGIAEEGSHEQLIKQNGIYASLYALQFR